MGEEREGGEEGTGVFVKRRDFWRSLGFVWADLDDAHCALLVLVHTRGSLPTGMIVVGTKYANFGSCPSPPFFFLVFCFLVLEKIKKIIIIWMQSPISEIKKFL